MNTSTMIPPSEESLLVITPSKLIFEPPFVRPITNILRLTNTCKQHVSYKVKTTARKRYIVRPNTGVISPGSAVEIQVTLNVKEAPTDLHSHDKFQIQSLVLDGPVPGENELKEVWNQTAEDKTIKQRLKCYFERPNSGPTFVPTLQQQSKSESDHHQSGTEENSQSQQEFSGNSNRNILDDSSSKDSDEHHGEPDPVSELKKAKSVIDKLEKDLKKISKEYRVMNIQRDNLKGDVEKLRTQLIQERENLRQRKLFESNRELQQQQQTQQQQLQVQQLATQLKPGQNGLIYNQTFQLLVIAILFFLIGYYM